MKRALLITVSIVLTVFLVTFAVIYFAVSSLGGFSYKDVRTLEFPNRDTLYLSAESWGIAGNNERVVLSAKVIESNDDPDKRTDYIFYTSELYYKIEANKLTIYVDKSSVLQPSDFTDAVNIEVVGLKTADEIRDYNLNYQNYGLQRISVYGE